MTIAGIIRDYREKHDIARATLAKQLGVCEARVRQLEHGSLPTIPTLARMAKFFGWSETHIGRIVLSARGAPPGPSVRRGRVGRAMQ